MVTIYIFPPPENFQNLAQKKFFFFFSKFCSKKGLFWPKKNVKKMKIFFFWMVLKIVLGYFFEGNDTLGDPWGPKTLHMSSFGIASILEKKWFFFFWSKIFKIWPQKGGSKKSKNQIFWTQKISWDMITGGVNRPLGTL